MARTACRWVSLRIITRSRLSAKGADESFAGRVHARKLGIGGAQDRSAGGLETASNEAVKFEAAVADQVLDVLGPVVEAEGEVAGLLHGPLTGRVRGDSRERGKPDCGR